MNNKTTCWKFISNPFEKIAGGKALAAGLATMFATAFVGSASGTAFDGVLDVHFYPHSLLYAVSAQAASWVILVLAMFLAGKIVSKTKWRLIDMAGTMAFARIPFLPLAFLGFIPAFKNLAMDVFSKLPVILILAFVSLIFIAWAIYWMYKAFSVSANLRKTAHIFIFAVALFVAEAGALCTIHYGLRTMVSGSAKQEQTTVPEHTKEDAYNKTRAVIALIETRDFHKIWSSFDKNTREALPPERLQMMWAQAQHQFGEFQGFEDDTKTTVKSGIVTTQTTARFSKVKLALHLTFDKNGQIESFFIKPLLF